LIPKQEAKDRKEEKKNTLAMLNLKSRERKKMKIYVEPRILAYLSGVSSS